MTNEADRLIEQFNDRHDLDVDSQFKQLGEEFGELARALNRGETGNAIEEAHDVVFVARSICLLLVDDPDLRQLAGVHELSSQDMTTNMWSGLPMTTYEWSNNCSRSGMGRNPEDATRPVRRVRRTEENRFGGKTVR